MYLKGKWLSWLEGKGSFLILPWNLAAFLKQSLKLQGELKTVWFTFFGSSFALSLLSPVMSVRYVIVKEWARFHWLIKMKMLPVGCVMFSSSMSSWKKEFNQERIVLSDRSLFSKMKVHFQEGWRAGCLETRSSSVVRARVGF